MKKQIYSNTLAWCGLIRISLACALFCLCATSAARAAESPKSESPKSETNSENIIEEIVVTSSRKRVESAQDTPVPITAVNTEMLDRFHVNNPVDLQKLSPNLSIHKAYVAPDVASIYLRGFGSRSNASSIEPAVPIIVDGIYSPVVNASMLDTFDFATVEILKGPQSTLVGKNTASGALSITTLRPTGEFGGKAQIDFARFNRIEGRASLDFPITTTLAGKLSLVGKSGGHYVTNLPLDVTDQGGEEVIGGRLGLLFTPNDNVDWYVTLQRVVNTSPQEGQRGVSGEGSGTPWAPTPLACLIYGFCTPQERFTNNSGMVKHEDSRTFDIASILDWTTGAVQWSSLTGYKNLKLVNNEDVDMWPAQILDVQDTFLSMSYISQEFRLANSFGGGLDMDGKLDWVTGVYYNSHRYFYTQPTYLLEGILPPISLDQRLNANSYAAFAHAEFHFNDAWSANVGVRYTRDEKDYQYTPSYVLATGADLGTGLPVEYVFNDATFKKTTFEGGPTYRIDEHKMIFLRFATGYRSGGLNSVAPAPGNPSVYEPETVESAELGLKTEWLDQRLRVNANVFYNKYKDLQKDVSKAVFNPAGEQVGYIQLLANAASGTTKGVELETIAVPNDALTLRLNVGYIDAKFDDYFADITGSGVEQQFSHWDFPWTPKMTLLVAADWVVQAGPIGTFTLGADYDWRDKHIVSVLDIQNSRQSAYGLLNAQVRFDHPDGRFYATLYGSNILSKKYLVAWEDASGIATGVLDGLPAMYGVIVGMSF